MDVRAIGEKLAGSWFETTLSRVFVDRHTGEVARSVTASGVFIPGITTVDIVQSWESVRDRYLAIPDDVIESGGKGTDIAKELKAHFVK